MSSSKLSKIPVILCIDVEPDPFLVNRFNPEPWVGYEGTQGYLATMRTRFEEATGSPVHYTWCFRMDPQVAESYGSQTWGVDRYPEFTKEIEQHGDELGTHTHAYRWLEDQQTWLDDLGNQDWINYCVEMSLDAHMKAFGQPCRTFRFGNFWMNNATLNLLEKRGIHYEMTVEPGLSPHYPGILFEKGCSIGARPDYRYVPRVPYEPSEADFLKPGRQGSRSLKIIPLTSGYLRYGMNIRARWRHLRENGVNLRRQYTPLSMWKNWQAPNTYETLLDRAISSQANPYLAFAIRSSIGTGRSFKFVDHCLNALLKHPKRKRFVFSTPAEALTILHTQKALS